MIKARKIKLVGQEDATLNRVMTREEAIKLARDSKMDLVQVDSKQQPPICRIFDFNREQYRKKVEAKAKAATPSTASPANKLKEVRVGAKADVADVQLALSKIKQFLEKGFSIKVTVVSSRRHRAERLGLVRGMVQRLVDNIADVGRLVGNPSVENLNYSFRLVEGKSAPRTAPLLPELNEAEREEVEKFEKLKAAENDPATAGTAGPAKKPYKKTFKRRRFAKKK
eukprot:c11938_g1_i1.p1 GENE.c11938_g1_i1~~c11938_g1_i1.p1  ORF type:complete len:226 (-),score=59.95 c11938_g1_i1:107-784(-)